MRPSGLITLTTDFGLSDPFVGTMKAVIGARAPQVRCIDMTHGIAAHDPGAAGFWLVRFYSYCAPGTVHVAIVDPGVGTARRALAAHLADHWFIAPDNGLLTELSTLGAEFRVIELDRLSALKLDVLSRTFHGRDLFAPVAAALASGEIAFDELGGPCEPVRCPLFVARRDGDCWHGRVMVADHFGNLLTNLGPLHLNGGRCSQLTFRGQDLPWRENYAAIGADETAAIVSSFQVIEIARRGRPVCDHPSDAIGDGVILH